MRSKRSRGEAMEVVETTVDDVVIASEEGQEHQQEHATQEAPEDSESNEIRRSGRTRKVKQLLDNSPVEKGNKKKIAETKMRQKKIKIDENFEFEMEPAPATLRSILRPASSFASSPLADGTPRTRKIRVSRRLQFQVIPPLPGWSADKARMPEDALSRQKKLRSPQKSQQKWIQKTEQKSPQKTLLKSPQKTLQKSPQKATLKSPQKTLQKSPQKATLKSPQKALPKSPQKASQKSPQKSKKGGGG